MAKTDIDSAQSTNKATLNTTQTQANNTLNPAITGYSNFAQTGGVTPQQQQQTLSQTQGTNAGIFDALKQNLSRQKAVQGGYSPGFGANEASLGRQASSAANSATTNANLGLLQQIQQGKLAGLGGLSNIGSLYQSQIPQFTQQQDQLAVAKPSWYQNIEGGLGAIGGIGKGIAGLIAGA